MLRKQSVLSSVAVFLVFLIPNTFNGDTPVDDFNMSQIFGIDRGHSYVGFLVKYMGFARVRGRFTDFSGAIRYDENDITKTSATIIIKTESIDTDLDFRDRDLKSDNWFDVEKYPTIKFQSKRAAKTELGFDIIGDLTIKNVTKEVKIRMAQPSGVQNDVRGDSQVICTGSITIDRNDYGVEGKNWSRVVEGIMAVAPEIEIELSLLGKQINVSNFRNRVRNIKSPQGKIYKLIAESGIETGIEEFNKLKSENESEIHEGILNIVGYMLLKEGNIDEAIEVFEQNADAYSDSPNVYDSLGEAYAVKGDKKNAIKYYEISLEKDPLNANALEVLRHLEN